MTEQRGGDRLLLRVAAFGTSNAEQTNRINPDDALDRSQEGLQRRKSSRNAFLNSRGVVRQTVGFVR